MCRSSQSDFFRPSLVSHVPSRCRLALGFHITHCTAPITDSDHFPCQTCDLVWSHSNAHTHLMSAEALPVRETIQHTQALISSSRCIVTVIMTCNTAKWTGHSRHDKRRTKNTASSCSFPPVTAAISYSCICYSVKASFKDR